MSTQRHPSFLSATSFDRASVRPIIEGLESRTLFAAGFDVAWVEYSANKIQHKVIGGAGGQLYQLPDPNRVKSMHGLAADPTGEIYWVENDETSLPRVGRIMRMDSDGSNVVNILTFDEPDGTRPSFRGITIDPAGGYIYYTDATDFGHNGTVNRVHLNGTGMQVLETQGSSVVPSEIRLDLMHGKMYWTDYATQNVYRANLDGTGLQSIISGVYTTGIGIDAVGDKLYFTRRDGSPGSYTYKIVTTDLAGGHMQDLFTTGYNDPRDLAIDVDAGVGFVDDLGSGRVLQFNLNGTGSPAVVASGLTYPIGVTIVPDPSAASISLSPPAAQTATAEAAATLSLGRIAAYNTTAPLMATINWGDGSANSSVPVTTAIGPLPATGHTFASAGTFTATVTVADAAGHASTPITFRVTVAPAPVVDVTLTGPGDQTATVGKARTFTLGSLAATNADAPYKVTVNWGDGTAATVLSVSSPGTLPGAAHTYSAAGHFTAKISAVDASGHAATPVSFVATVAAAPVISLTLTPPAARQAGVGKSTTFKLGSLAATNAKAPYKVTINWGDGTTPKVLSLSAPGTIPSTAHTYARTGKYTAKISAVDAAGHAATPVTFQVSVVLTGSIAGRVFNDVNGDGVINNGEVGVGNWRVYIDANHNGAYDAGDTGVLTDVNGLYKFSGLFAATYVIRVVQVAGTVVTKPVGGVRTIVLAAGQASASNTFGERAKK